MWSQWPCVSSTRRTPSDLQSSRSCSCSLAASSSTASPVRRQRTTNTLLSTGPTTTLCTSTSGFDQWSVVDASMAPSLSPPVFDECERRSVRRSPAFSVTFRSDCDRIVTKTAPCPDAAPDHRADHRDDLWAVVSLSPVTSPEPSTDRDFDQVEVDATLASTLDSLDDAENYRNWIVELAVALPRRPDPRGRRGTRHVHRSVRRVR